MTNQQTINALHATINNLVLIRDNLRSADQQGRAADVDAEIKKLAKLANWLDYGEPSDLFE